MPTMRFAIFVLAASFGVSAVLVAQNPATPSPTTSSISTSASEAEDFAGRPLPDIPALMHDVEVNQRKSEALQKNYVYHSVDTAQEVDSRGHIRKTEVTEYDHFWLDGVPVEKMVKKDGKPLSGDELAKEDKRIDKEVAKARERRDKADSQGKETDPRGNDEITVSRLLELGRFTNPRRVQMNGRSTIEVDYTGDPTAKTRNRAEEIVRDMRGTVWVDEEDHVMVRVVGEFVNSFKIGAGLLVSIRKGTHFEAESTKVNNEVWLPARAYGEGQARVLLLFNFNGSLQVIFSDYRKFRTSSTVLPGTPQTVLPKSQEGTGAK